MSDELGSLRATLEALGSSIGGVDAKMEGMREILEADRRQMVEVITRLASAERELHRLNETIFTGNGADSLKSIVSQVLREQAVMSRRMTSMEREVKAYSEAQAKSRGTVLAALVAGAASVASAVFHYFSGGPSSGTQ